MINLISFNELLGALCGMHSLVVELSYKPLDYNIKPRVEYKLFSVVEAYDKGELERGFYSEEVVMLKFYDTKTDKMYLVKDMERVSTKYLYSLLLKAIENERRCSSED